jgi:hypothetical protein
MSDEPTWTCEQCGATTTEPWATREYGILCPDCKGTLPWSKWHHTAEDIAYQPVSPRFPPEKCPPLLGDVLHFDGRAKHPA